MTFEFRVIQSSQGHLHLLGTHIDHYTPMLAINKLAGTRVVEMRGTILGVNLQITDKQAWSDHIAKFVKDPVDPEKDKLFTLEIPER